MIPYEFFEDASEDDSDCKIAKIYYQIQYLLIKDLLQIKIIPETVGYHLVLIQPTADVQEINI